MKMVQALVLVLVLVTPTQATVGTLYTSMSGFAQEVAGLEEFCDFWSAPGYDDGDGYTILTDAEMSGVLNEVKYDSTAPGMEDANIVSNTYYCTGNNCDGSFWWDFSSTSLSTPGLWLDGVYAFSTFLSMNEGDRWMNVLYDNATIDPSIEVPDNREFIGFVGDSLLINAVHFGGRYNADPTGGDGGAIQAGILCIYRAPLFTDGFESGDVSAWE